VIDPARVPRLGRSTATLAPGLHYLGRLYPSAAYAIETSEGLVLVDSGLAPDAGPLRQELAALGLDWRRVKAVLLTHAHVDHSGGSEFLRTATGARIHSGEGDAGPLVAGGPREALFSFFTLPENTIHPTRLDVELKGTETLVFGDVRVQALATPGHTPGSTCYLLERGSLRALFTGDVVMKLLGGDQPHREVAKPLGTYSAYLAPRFRGSATDFLATLRRLRSLAVPTLVLPGHPVDDREPQSPCLSQSRWEALLDAGIRDMEELLTRYQQDGEDFLDDSPKELLPGLLYLGEFSGTAVYGLFAAGRLYVVASPREPGLLRFLNDRLARLRRPLASPAALLLTSADAAEADSGSLAELIATGSCPVVAPRAGVGALRRAFPRGSFVASDDLPAKHWFPVQAIPLAGRGKDPVAYQVTWAGKSVLLTGQIPIATTSAALKALVDDLRNRRGDAVDLLQSLTRLESLRPDLWLPAVPSNGQNANLYGDEWIALIGDNQTIVKTSRWNLAEPGGTADR
jgi:glyoxylase-like metal-dependent hydrolase (beta-lactamase superfamily II)